MGIAFGIVKMKVTQERSNLPLSLPLRQSVRICQTYQRKGEGRVRVGEINHALTVPRCYSRLFQLSSLSASW